MGSIDLAQITGWNVFEVTDLPGILLQHKGMPIGPGASGKAQQAETAKIKNRIMSMLPSFDIFNTAQPVFL